MANRKRVSFKTSRGFVTFLSRQKEIDEYLKDENRKRIFAIATAIQDLGKELQQLELS